MPAPVKEETKKAKGKSFPPPNAPYGASQTEPTLDALETFKQFYAWHETQEHLFDFIIAYVGSAVCEARTRLDRENTVFFWVMLHRAIQQEMI